MAGPNLAAQGFTKQAAGQDTVPLTYTFSSNPVANDIIVVKLGTWGATDTMSAPTGGSQTFNATKIVAPGGFNQWCAIYTCKVTGSPGNFTITSTPNSSSRHSMEVEHWTAANLAGTPATNSTTTGTGAAQASVTTTQPNSVISWTSGDASSQDPATKVALSNNTFENVRDDHSGSNGVDYHGYMTTTTATSYTFGMSQPTGQTFVIAGVEVLAGSTTVTKDTVESYRVFNSVTKNQAESYRVLNSVTKDTVESYRVLNSVTKSQAESYRVLNNLTKDTVESYRVLNSITKNQAETYRVLNSVTKDTVEVYNVLGGTAQQKDTVEQYRIFNSVTKDQSETYRVFNAVTKDVVEQYNVLGGTAQQKDTVERYRVLNSGVKNQSETYRVFNSVTKDTVERYRIFNAGTMVLSVWDGTQEIPATLDGLWDGHQILPCTLEVT